ncbi:ABATE domain-containing protein [Actinoplanes sp. NPDC051861]|uniref:CGNR zinc finger domain-containing protein n=1 Tax=Actinoplanes sp. NPDC051861 TaxID=3155170 RepID=UPI00343DF16B
MTGEGVATRAPLLGEPLPVELMNTIAVIDSGIHDALADDDEAAGWLRAVGGRIATEAGADPDLTGDGLRRSLESLRELRDALRRLAAEMTADPRPPAAGPAPTRPEAIATLNALARARPEVVWPAGGQPARSYRAGNLAVALIAVQAVELFTGRARERLRPCLAPNCLLFFAKDHGRREWCSPACGNRARVARHYRRHHPSPHHGEQAQ